MHPIARLAHHAALSIFVAITFVGGLASQDEYTAQTVQTEPELVATEKLSIQVKPLTTAELEVELAAWLDVLKAKVQQVSELDLRVMEGTGAEQDAAGEEAVTARAERDAITRRVKVVAASLTAKGGDAASADKYVEAVAGLPPVTGFQATLINAKAWLLSSDGGVALAISVGLFLVVLIAFRIVASIVGGIMDRALTRLRKTSDLLRSFLVNTTKKVIFFIGIVVALGQLGIDVTPFVAAIGAAGFVIGFALQGTLSNFASGVMILIYRPYDIGDYVNAGGVAGTVDSMTLVSTSIKTPDNQTIVVPNGSIWGGVITNVTANPTRRVDLTFGVGYSDDIEKAQQILLELCEQHPLVLKDPAPVVKVGALADSSVNLICRPWSKTSDYWTVYWDLTHQVKQRFDKAGISIPFPQRDIHVYQHAVAAPAAS